MQLLDIFAELEKHNLSLIQYSQDTEETLDEMKKTIVKTKEKMYVNHSSNIHVLAVPGLLAWKILIVVTMIFEDNIFFFFRFFSNKSLLCIFANSSRKLKTLLLFNSEVPTYQKKLRLYFGFHIRVHQTCHTSFKFCETYGKVLCASKTTC